MIKLATNHCAASIPTAAVRRRLSKRWSVEHFLFYIFVIVYGAYIASEFIVVGADVLSFLRIISAACLEEHFWTSSV
jgi:hypothetical protein